ncbi:LCP family protein [Streptomyces sp. NRRL S-118]|uniref:LCP family protein n=1 Tax=Streptomyces sp. NRRL S-118 TaxID=1463881 RepID=UPI0004C8DA75|nr:LCP family protein [Streptomyces sp. NRRL S-118]
MNDQHNPYDPYYPPQPQIVGYDEYGQPVYQQAQQAQQQYDPYAQQQPQQYQQQQQQGYGYEQYAQPQQTQPYDGYPQQGQGGYGYDGYPGDGYGGYGTAQQPQQPQQWIPQQHQPQSQPDPQSTRQDPGRPRTASAPAREHGDPAPTASVPRPRRPAPDRDPGQGREASQDREYRTEQFAFVEDPDEESEDVIDWLKFTESRSERREEARRRGRNRIVALVAVLAVALVGGVGYLWSAGKLPGLGDDSTAAQGSTASGPQKRDTIVVHLHNTKNDDTSTALLVNNATTEQGTTVLLPNALSVAHDDGTTTTLAKSVDDDGSAGTREAIGALLGTEITGTWRLDTPYLENLVELVGGIDLTTDTEVPAAKKGEAPLVPRGENQTLNGRMAVAYATHRGPGEAEAQQLQRFGQVMYGVLRKMSDDPRAATVTVETLAQILDPSLPEKDLGASLAKLAEHAKVGDYKTALLPVQQDGTLSEEAARSVVKDILGGSVTAPEQGSAVRVGVKNASGDAEATEAARIVLVNGGYAVIDGGKAAGTEAATQVLYGDAAHKAKAEEVAKTLGLPAGAVEKGTPPANTDVMVVLGRDYEAG